jgi:hypothetical protein
MSNVGHGFGRTIWIVDAHRGDGKRFIVHADEKLSAFVERQVLTVTFNLRSHSCRLVAVTNEVIEIRSPRYASQDRARIVFDCRMANDTAMMGQWLGIIAHHVTNRISQDGLRSLQRTH